MSTRVLPAYRGGDRRLAAGPVAIEGRRVAACSVVGGLAAGVLCLLVLVAAGADYSVLDPIVSTACGVFSVASGLLLLCAWRISGRVVTAFLAVAALVLAVVPPLLTLLAVLLPPQRGEGTGAIVVALAAVTASGAVLRGLRSPEVRSDLHLGREAGLAFAAVPGSGVLAYLLGAGTTALSSSVAVALPVVVLTGVAAVLASQRGTQDPSLHAAVVAVPALAAAAAASFALPEHLGVVVRTVCAGAGTALMAATAAEVLRWAFRAQGMRSLRMLAALARYEDESARERRRRHDARSALAAVRAATSTLATNGLQLDVATRSELAVAVREELSRVERLLDPSTQPRPRLVDVTAALEPVLQAWRTRGLRIEPPPTSHLVADPDVVLRIVGNLLDNVHRHSAATSVLITATREDGTVHLAVSDNGIGIPADSREAVFEPGVSLVAGSAGSGVGLPSARALAEGQGGRLRLADSVTGTTVVLSLPAAPTQDARDQAIMGPASVAHGL